MRRAHALPAAGLLLVAAALFLSDGSSGSRLFWIGSGALAVASLAGIAVLLGYLPAPALSSAGAAFLGLLAAFALWQAVSIAWSIQASRSWDYANRGLVYLAFASVGVLLAGVPKQRLASGLAALLGALFAYALAAKAVPAFYDDYGRLARLRAPLGYWNELGLLGAASVPLGLWLASAGGRARVAGTLLVYAALVVVVLTYSRVGVVLALLAGGIWLVLERGRLEGFVALGLAVPAAAFVSGLGVLLPGVADDGEPRAVRFHDGLLFAALVLGGVAVVAAGSQVLAGRELGGERGRRLARAGAAAAGGLVVAALLVAVVRAGGPVDFAKNRWHEFSNPVSVQISNAQGRLASGSSSNRWRWWQEAWQGFTDDPIQGSGAGSFAITDRNLRRSSLATVEPHNTPLQFLSETGIVGFALYAGMLTAAALALRRRPRDRATTALALFAGLCVLHSIVDIDWGYVAVQGPLFLVLGALVAGPGRPLARRRVLPALAVAVCLLAALYSLASPWLSERRLQASYDAIGRGDLTGALDAVKQSHSLNPLAIQPLLLWAAAESAIGDDRSAERLYLRARDREPRNPETWYELGSFELTELERPRLAYVHLNQSYTLDRFGPAGVPCNALDIARYRVFGTGPGSKCPGSGRGGPP